MIFFIFYIFFIYILYFTYFLYIFYILHIFYNLFLQLIAQSIRNALPSDHYQDAISITKKSLLDLSSMNYSFMNIVLVSLPRPTTIDFSHLKSLSN